MKIRINNLRILRNLIVLVGLSMGIIFCSSLMAVAQTQNNSPISQNTPNNLYYSVQRYAKIVPGLRRIISVHANKKPISKVLQEITQKAGLGIAYNANLASLKEPITIDLHDITVVKALQKVLTQTPFKPMLSRWRELVLEKRIPLKLQMATLQETVTGTVTDAQTGDPLPGVNILVVGTSTGAATDSKGHYSLSVPSLQDTLRFSFIGYKQQMVPIDGRTIINIAMKPTIFSGQQMVVIGYGTQKKQNLTGAVSNISSKEIETKSVNNTVGALRGLSPGLNIGVTNQGGELDASRSLNIRGVGSLSGSHPYILIDGVRATQKELAELNPNTIKNVSVLKGASASAIYGSHAAYGAILVTTKSGKKNQPFTVDYSTNMRLKKLIFVPPSVNSLTFAKVANQASINFSGEPIFTKEHLAKIRAYLEGNIKNQTEALPGSPNEWRGIEKGTSAGWYSGYANTDWFNLLYKNIDVTQKHNIDISGGTDKMTFYLSGGYLNDPGHLKYGDNNEYYNKYDLNSNISANITDWLTVRNITRFERTGSSFPASLDLGTRGRYYHDIMRFAPIIPYKTPPVKDSQGNIIVPSQTTMLAGFLQKNGFNRHKVNNFVTTLKANIDINDALSIKGNFTFKKRFVNNLINYKKWTLLGPDGEISQVHQGNSNQIKKELRKYNYTTFNIYGNYRKTFANKHNIHITLGYQQEQEFTNKLSVARKNVIDNGLNSFNVATGEILGPNNPLTDFGSLGAFGRVQYNYKQKYLFEFSGRYDGSSKFAPNHRFVFSPSFSAGYNISKENFWDPIHQYISNLKIRASYGKLGNQNICKNLNQSACHALYLLSIPIHEKLGYVIGDERPIYTTMPAIKSPNITWEVVTSKDIGADLGFLNNRLTATIDYYERDTDDMFAPSAALPAVLGTSPPQTNSGSLRTRGWELALAWHDHVNNDLSYDIKLMGSSNQTVITKYHNPNKVLSSYYVGETLGEIWGYKTNGLFQSKKEVDNYLSKVDLNFIGTNWQPGDVKYKDLNGDGKVDEGDNTLSNPGDRVIIGNNHPRYHFSILAGATWKGLSVNMLWQGVGKREVWIPAYSTIFWGWNRKAHSHITKHNMDTWSPDNHDAYLPIALDANGKAGFGKDRVPSTRYLQNAAYIRLKSLRLSYSLPESLIDKIGLNNLTVFVDGENLVALTPLWPDIDPELADPRGFRQNAAGLAYPLSQVYGFGINISL